jgi:hypothetical protein
VPGEYGNTMLGSMRRARLILLRHEAFGGMVTASYYHFRENGNNAPA